MSNKVLSAIESPSTTTNDESKFFLSVPLGLVNQTILSNNEVLLLSKIIYLSNKNNNVPSCFASYNTLAKWLGTTTIATHNTANNLQKKGFIKLGWIHENLTRNSVYLRTKHKTPTHITQLAIESDSTSLYIPDHIASSQILNATDKLIYGAINLIKKAIRKKDTSIKADQIQEILPKFNLRAIYVSLKKMRENAILTNRNLPKVFDQQIESTLSSPRTRMPRGLTKPGYSPKPRKRIADQLYFSFSYRNPVQKKASAPISTLTFDSLMNAFVSGLPNVVLSYKERGDNFLAIIPTLLKKDKEFNNSNNIDMFARGHALIIAKYLDAQQSLELIPDSYFQGIVDHIKEPFLKSLSSKYKDVVQAKIENIIGGDFESEICQPTYGTARKLYQFIEQNYIISDSSEESKILGFCLQNIHYRDQKCGVTPICSSENLAVYLNEYGDFEQKIISSNIKNVDFGLLQLKQIGEKYNLPTITKLFTDLWIKHKENVNEKNCYV